MVTVDSASEKRKRQLAFKIANPASWHKQNSEKAEREKAWNREDRQADGGKDSATREAHGLPEGYARQRGFQLYCMNRWVKQLKSLEEEKNHVLPGVVKFWNNDRGWGILQTLVSVDGRGGEVYLNLREVLCRPAQIQHGDNLLGCIVPAQESRDPNARRFAATNVVHVSNEVPSDDLKEFGRKWQLREHVVAWLSRLPVNCRHAALRAKLDGEEDPERTLCEVITKAKGDHRPRSRHIRLAGLPDWFSEELLADYLQPHGEVQEVRLSPLPFCSDDVQEALVRMETSEQAEAAVLALRGKVPPDCPFPLHAELTQAEDTDPNERLQVTGFPISEGPAFLYQLFGPYGKVLDVRLEGASAAMVRMNSTEAARTAIACLHGEKLEGAAQPLSVSFHAACAAAPPPRRLSAPPAMPPRRSARPPPPPPPPVDIPGSEPNSSGPAGLDSYAFAKPASVHLPDPQPSSSWEATSTPAQSRPAPPVPKRRPATAPTIRPAKAKAAEAQVFKAAAPSRPLPKPRPAVPSAAADDEPQVKKEPQGLRPLPKARPRLPSPLLPTAKPEASRPRPSVRPEQVAVRPTKARHKTSAKSEGEPRVKQEFTSP